MTARQNTEIAIPNFAGGQASAKGVGTLESNEFVAMTNVILKSGGNGFRSREANSLLNTVALASGAAVTGLGYLKTASANEYAVAVCGSTVSSDTNFSGTFVNRTGTLSITAGQNNHWTLFQSDNLLIGVGGAPDAPFKYTGTGNAVLLGGTPPNGRHGFQYGNRTFIMSTASDPSTIFWSGLLDPEDWISVESGSADVEPDDGDILVTAAPINLNTVILFKRNSTHLMTGRDAPFPVFPLFDGIGCVGKHACVVFNGLAHFVTSDGHMAITDGNAIIQQTHLPDIDDVWKSFRAFRLPYIQGKVVRGPDFDWIIWSSTLAAATTNDYAAVWDLRNQCWLQCPRGFEANSFMETVDNVTYMGGYDGKVYRLFAPNTYTDASNGAAVTWAVESDWITLDGLLSVKQVNLANILTQTRATGTMTFSYGYDFNNNLSSSSFSVAASGAALWDSALWDSAVWDGYNGKLKNIPVFGRGNAFKWKLSGSNATVGNEVSKVGLFGKNKGQRRFGTV